MTAHNAKQTFDWPGFYGFYTTTTTATQFCQHVVAFENGTIIAEKPNLNEFSSFKKQNEADIFLSQKTRI